MTTGGKIALVILGIAAVGTAGYFIFRKKKPGMTPGGTAISTEPGPVVTNPYVAPAEQKKKKNTGKIIAGIAAAGATALALDLLIKGKKNKEKNKQQVGNAVSLGLKLAPL